MGPLTFCNPMSFPDLPKKVSLPDLEAAATGLNACVLALAGGFPDLRVVDEADLEVRRTARVHVGAGWIFGHTEQDDIRLSLMKLVRIASANHAALQLIGAGYVQAARALWRMIDAAYQDIVSMSGPLAEVSVPGDARGRWIDAPLQQHAPSLAEAVHSQANYLFRSLLAAALVARGANRTDVVERVSGMAAELARTTGCLDARPLER